MQLINTKRMKLHLSPLEIIKNSGEKHPLTERIILYYIQLHPQPVTITKVIDLILCENQNEDEIELINELKELPFQIIPKDFEKIEINELNHQQSSIPIIKAIICELYLNFN